MALSVSRRQSILDLLAEEPGVEWCAEEVAERLEMPLGSAGSVLSTMWRDRVVDRRRIGMRYWYQHLGPVDPPAPVVTLTLGQVAAAWTALGLGAWTPEQVDLAMRVADYVRGRDAEHQIDRGPGLWSNGYSGSDRPPGNEGE